MLSFTFDLRKITKMGQGEITSASSFKSRLFPKAKAQTIHILCNVVP